MGLKALKLVHPIKNTLFVTKFTFGTLMQL